jgi:hypothetical protein
MVRPLPSISREVRALLSIGVPVVKAFERVIQSYSPNVRQ